MPPLTTVEPTRRNVSSPPDIACDVEHFSGKLPRPERTKSGVILWVLGHLVSGVQMHRHQNHHAHFAQGLSRQRNELRLDDADTERGFTAPMGSDEIMRCRIGPIPGHLHVAAMVLSWQPVA